MRSMQTDQGGKDLDRIDIMTPNLREDTMNKLSAGCIQVLLVDDHPVLVEALKLLIDSSPDMSVTSTASDAESGLDQCLIDRPDVVVIDIDMPGGSCFDAVEQMRRILPDLHIVFFSAFCEDHLIERALRVGAKGYLIKRESPEILRDAIRRIVDGGFCFSDEVLARLTICKKSITISDQLTTRSSLLSDRETEVLRYLATGLSKKQIATKMNRSVKTIAAHTENIMSKLDIHDRVELARYAIREGLVFP